MTRHRERHAPMSGARALPIVGSIPKHKPQIGNCADCGDEDVPVLRVGGGGMPLREVFTAPRQPPLPLLRSSL
jgi:hypothetical protein